MTQLEHIDAIEKRLWSAADMLRANSNFASNEYFLPVMGLVFLRHADSRYHAAKKELESRASTRAGKKRAPTKADFSARNSIFLQPHAQFEHLVGLPDSDDRAKAIISAMESIEDDYESLRGILPKDEYRRLDNGLIGNLLRQLNPEELKRVSGDVFGRIYEYFLTRFAGQKAHDNGEFFTPVSLVALIAHVIDPRRGSVLDPACGSGGMFVQSARTVEERGSRPAEQLTFYGMEKNVTTIRLAKMNLAVHGLAGNILQAITYYDDPHKLAGKADFVMANPPFNVDEIDAGKIRDDRRIPFGLPGTNKQGNISNGNYVWISYFYSYLNARGRAGFVMSSQASSAGGFDAQVRRKLIESGDVEAMIAIRANFFYTRAVPCELWFFNRAKPAARRDGVLMIDARNTYRKVTRSIYDFSPEQQRNLLAIVHLHRGESERYLALLAEYCARTLAAAGACIAGDARHGKSQDALLPEFAAALAIAQESMGFSRPLKPAAGSAQARAKRELDEAGSAYNAAETAFREAFSKQKPAPQTPTNAALKKAIAGLITLSDASKTLAKQIEILHKLAINLLTTRDKKAEPKNQQTRITRDTARARKTLDAARQTALAQLKQVHYFHRQACYLTERFPDAKLRDVAGLVKLVSTKEISENDWSLTPGRYVGVSPEQADEDFDFTETMRGLHAELRELNTESAKLAGKIDKNLATLGL
ncbi:MAG: N-6 DNA methylase [Gammaproteobacteria bacterium]